MLPAAFRLRRSDDIAMVVRTGLHISTPYVRIHAVLKPDNSHSRLACVVGKKVHSSAVQRHRYQRWLRVYAEDLLKELKMTYDIVLVGQPSLNTVTTYAQLKETLQDVSNQLDKRHL